MNFFEVVGAIALIIVVIIAMFYFMKLYGFHDNGPEEPMNTNITVNCRELFDEDQLCDPIINNGIIVNETEDNETNGY